MQKFRQSWASAEERPTNFAIPGNLRLSALDELCGCQNIPSITGSIILKIMEIMEVLKMASIVKRGKTYSIVYYEGEGKDRHQVWESGLSYNAAKARKALN